MELSLFFASEHNQIEVHIRLEWRDLSIAVHDLDVGAQSSLHSGILFQETYGLVIDRAVQDGLLGKEPSIYK
jgi:hypothetical protein